MPRHTYSANYPATVAEILDPAKRYKPAALAAVRELRHAKPWRGTIAERQAKFAACVAALAVAYDMTPPVLTFGPITGDSSGASTYCPGTHTINLVGRLSVVTLLHEFAHARGYDERDAARWSVNLFARIFRRSYARCQHVGHTLVQAAPPAETPAEAPAPVPATPTTPAAETPSDAAAATLFPSPAPVPNPDMATSPPPARRRRRTRRS